jgi:hypothetical protein
MLRFGATTTASSVSQTFAFGSEEDLVGNLCAPGGMRAAPDPEDLRQFVEAASSMDGLRIGELLMQKMVRLIATGPDGYAW